MTDKPQTTDAAMILWLDETHPGERIYPSMMPWFRAIRNRLAELTPTKDAEELANRVTFCHDVAASRPEWVVEIIQAALTAAEQRGYDRGKADKTTELLPPDIQTTAESLAEEIFQNYVKAGPLKAIPWRDMKDKIAAALQAERNAVSDIPVGWRFYTCDASIEGRFAVTIVRSGNKYKHWFLLSEEEKETTNLYLTGIATTIHDAVESAIAKIKP